MLDDVVVEFGFRAFERKFDRLARSFRGVTHGARKACVQIADGHHARGCDFVLQVVRELGEFVDIGIDAAHETFELREDFRDVCGNFRERARKNVDVVVAVHLELAEFEKIARNHRRHRYLPAAECIHLRRLAARHQAHMQPAEFVLVLKVGNLVCEAALRKGQALLRVLTAQTVVRASSCG